MAHQQDARVFVVGGDGAFELERGEERVEGARDARVHLREGLAFARGVVDGGPGGVDLREVGAEGGGGGGARVQARVGSGGGVPFREASKRAGSCVRSVYGVWRDLIWGAHRVLRI